MFRTFRRWLPKIRAAGARVAMISLLALAGGSVQAQEITATNGAGGPELSVVAASGTTTEMAAQPNMTASLQRHSHEVQQAYLAAGRRFAA